MSNHITIGKVADDDVESLVFYSIDQLIGHFINGHFRFQIISRNFRAGNQNTVFTLKFLFFAAVKEKRYVSIFFGFGNTQLCQAMLGNDFTKDVVQNFGAKNRFHKPAMIDRIFRHADTFGKMNNFFAGKTIKLVVSQRIQNFAGTIGAEVAH